MKCVSTLKQVIMQYIFNKDHKENMSEVKENVHHRSRMVRKTSRKQKLETKWI